MNNSSIILLSGGLDSLVTLGLAKQEEKYNVKLALTFDYGQMTSQGEIETSSKICQHYDIEHKVIKLEWLKEITKTALVTNNNLPNGNFGTTESAKAVWVPNRNSLFLNITACFCDSLGYKYILYGANKDEASNFPDNTEDFRKKISESFKSSTLEQPQVIAPLINYSKSDIVRIALDGNMPLDLVRSCYKNPTGHCGECESCHHLKNALISNKAERYIGILFRENEN